MSRYIRSLITEVQRLARDSKEDWLQNEDITSAINDAVAIYSMAYPYRKVEDKTGDGSTYGWAIADDYLPNYSAIENVQYPVTDTDRKPQYLRVGYDYQVIQTSTLAYVLRLFSITPSDGSTLRIIYTTLHSVTATTSTLPNIKAERQVIYLAAAIGCMQIAAQMAQGIDPTLEEVGSDKSLNTQQYQDLAATYAQMSGLKNFLEQGFADEEVASYFKDIDPDPMWAPYIGDYLTHTRRRR